MTRDEVIEYVKSRAGGEHRWQWMELHLNDVFAAIDKLKPFGIHLAVIEDTAPAIIEYPKAVTDPNSGIVFEVLSKEEEDAVLAGNGPAITGTGLPVQPEEPFREFPKAVIAPSGVIYTAPDEQAETAILAGTDLDKYETQGVKDPFIPEGAKETPLAPPVAPPVQADAPVPVPAAPPEPAPPSPPLVAPINPAQE